MTRYQVWKARERARFRAIAEWARIKRLGVRATKDDINRAHDALDQYDDVCWSVTSYGITRPFLG